MTLNARRTWIALIVIVSACGGSTDDGLKTGQGANGGASTIEAGAGAGPLEDGGGATAGMQQVGGSGGATTGGTGGTLSGVCDSDRDCTPFGQLCNMSTGQCADCIQDRDCMAEEACRSGVCTRVYRCNNSLDCVDVPDGKSVCDAALGECVECVVEADCGPNNDCTANQCIAFTPCVNSLDCPTGQVCDPAIQRCVGCVADPDCASGQMCRSGSCVPSGCVSRGCAGQCGLVDDGCGVNIDCGPCGTHCTNGVQDADEAGVDCGGLDCTPCPPPSGEGAWAQCTVNADCQGGRICTKAVQESLLPGRPGACVQPCPTGTPANCDPAPAGGTVNCLFLTTTMCVLTCGTCPSNMECYAGYCFYLP